MRHDMFKVIVERPRRGGKSGEHHPVRAAKRFKLDEELEVSDEYCGSKMSVRRPFRKGWNYKELNENLRPLERFLNSSVGRPWSDVYSEICENLSPNSTVQQHVRDHVDQYVDVNTYLGDDGCTYLQGSNYGGNYYVDPQTGALCKVKHLSYRIRQRERALKTKLTKIYTDEFLYEQNETSKLWFKYELVKLTESIFNSLPKRDVFSVPDYWNPKKLQQRTSIIVTDMFGKQYEMSVWMTVQTVYDKLLWQLQRENDGHAVFVNKAKQVSVNSYDLEKIIRPVVAETQAKLDKLLSVDRSEYV